MRTCMIRLGGWGVLGVALLVTTPAVRAQARPAADDKPAGVHRIEIINGATRTVHYVGVGLSPTELTALRDLERAENEVALADQLLALKRQYVNNEIGLDMRRRAVQQLYYGYQSQYSFSGFSSYSFPGFGYSYPFGYLGSPLSTSLAGFTGASAYGTAFGVGDEGALKTDLSRILALQSTPEYAAHARRQLDLALARASDTPGLKGKILPAGAELPTVGRDIVTLKDGSRLEGKLVKDDADWVTVDTGTGEERVRTTEVVRIFRHKAKP